jgi:hypothetical protein
MNQSVARHANRKPATKGGENGAFVDLRPDVRAKLDNPDPDALISRLATKQYGVVSRNQLRSAGLSSTGVGRRISAKRLHRIHRDVLRRRAHETQQ